MRSVSFGSGPDDEEISAERRCAEREGGCAKIEAMGRSREGAIPPREAMCPRRRAVLASSGAACPVHGARGAIPKDLVARPVACSPILNLGARPTELGGPLAKVRARAVERAAPPMKRRCAPWKVSATLMVRMHRFAKRCTDLGSFVPGPWSFEKECP